MLDPILDKLRNKELSFWCFIKENPWDTPLWATWGTFRYGSKADTEDRSYDTIVGHPLTRWRICHVYNKLEWHCSDYDEEKYDSFQYEVRDAFVDMEILMDNYSLYDQTELEWQKSEKRPELRSLLIQFSNYL